MVNDESGLFENLMLQANIPWSEGHLDKAENLYAQAEQLCRESNNKQHLIHMLNMLATMADEKGELRIALEINDEFEGISRFLLPEN